MSGADDDMTHRHSQLFTEKSTQGFISHTIDGWRSKTDLQRVAMDAGKFRAFGIRLGMNSENHTVGRLGYGRMLEGQIPVQDSNTERAMPLWRIMAKRVPNASSA